MGAETPDSTFYYFPPYFSSIKNGATGGNRTRDLFLTKEALYRLSYSGIRTRLKHSNEPGSFLLLSAHFLENQKFSQIHRTGNWKQKMERVKGIEPS